jgi:hypothetical protein
MLAANTRLIGGALWQCHTQSYRDTYHYHYSYTYSFANTDGDSYTHCNSNTNSNGKTYSDSEVYSRAERAADSKAEALTSAGLVIRSRTRLACATQSAAPSPKNPRFQFCYQRVRR